MVTIRSLIVLTLAAVFVATTRVTLAQDQLRVFIRSGPEVPRPGRTRLPALPQGLGAAAERARRAGRRAPTAFPTKAQLDETDVLILHAQEAGNIADADGPEEPRRSSSRAAAAWCRSTPARSRAIPTGSGRSSAARGATARRSGSKVRCTSTSPIATARSRRTRPTGRWTTRSTTTWT